MIRRWLLALVFALAGSLYAHPVATEAFEPQVPAKRIAITFDDPPRGPGAFMAPAERTRRLIAGMRAAGVWQAAFFVNPGRISPHGREAALIRDYVAAGHVIANHTATHQALSRIGAQRFLADVDRAEAWLKREPGYRPWLRFPFLDEGGRDKARRDAVREGLRARGIRDAPITVDGSDWMTESFTIAARRRGHAIDMAALRDLYVETHVQSAEWSDRLARRVLGRSPAHVLLLHETDLAALFLPDLIDALRARGWAIVTADQALADPVMFAQPDTALANGSVIQMLAWERGVTGNRWYDRNDPAVAARLFATRVLKEPGR